MALRLKRGTNAERLNYTPELGELIYVTDYQSAGVSPLWIGDGSTIGGNEASSTGTGITDIVNDTTPELGGNLNLNNFDVIGIGDLDIDGSIDITGSLTATTALIGDISGDLTGSLFSGDSTKLVDGDSGFSFFRRFFSDTNEFNFQGSTTGVDVKQTLLSVDSDAILNFVHKSDSDIAGNTALNYGYLFFGRNDINGTLVTSVIAAKENGLFFGNSADGNLSGDNKYFVWQDQKLGVGVNPTVELDVIGDAQISGNLTAGALNITGSILDTTDSSEILVTPSVRTNASLTVDQDLDVGGIARIDTLEVTNFTTSGVGTPEIESDSSILFTAADRVAVTQSPFKLASYTTIERDALTSENGDMIYNTDTNKFQGYANGVWVDLH